MTITIGLHVFDGVEVLDFAGPFEVFTTASRMHAREHAGAPALLRVCTIARTREAVTARAGLAIQADATMAGHPPLDVLIVPGGVVAAELDKPDVIAWIAAQAARVPLTASVCTGAFLLARAGVLDGLRATTHWEDLADLRALFPRVEVVDGVRWVDQGRVVTSAGISAGIDMSLHLVERLHDRALALRTARQMDFDWTENA
jgi:transcriptional regulator GlxA family with amidase domain